MPGYPYDAAKDTRLLTSMAEAYPGVNLRAELLKMQAWLDAEGLLPVRGTARPRHRVRNWMSKADEDAHRAAAKAARSRGSEDVRPCPKCHHLTQTGEGIGDDGMRYSFSYCKCGWNSRDK